MSLGLGRLIMLSAGDHVDRTAVARELAETFGYALLDLQMFAEAGVHDPLEFALNLARLQMQCDVPGVIIVGELADEFRDSSWTERVWGHARIVQARAVFAWVCDGDDAPEGLARDVRVRELEEPRSLFGTRLGPLLEAVVSR